MELNCLSGLVRVGVLSSFLSKGMGEAPGGQLQGIEGRWCCPVQALHPEATEGMRPGTVPLALALKNTNYLFWK